MTEALQRYETALTIIRETGDRGNEALILSSLGTLHRNQGRSDEGLQYYERALAIQRALEDRRSTGMVLGEIGGLLSEQGRAEEAGSYYQQALEIHREVGNRQYEGIVVGNLGVLAVNDLDETCYATPAIADGRIYIRTEKALYCFGTHESTR